ncbi:MAG TPA: hypothetical protein VKG38_14740 [Solirubrobacteraceae bacterium]|nr:hypothetical protein [Solirubrobacteraceae bacterium]
MRKKLLAGFAPLLAIAAFGLAPAAAQAAPPHWFSNGVMIPPGVTEPVATSGKLTFTIHDPGVIYTIKCTVHDQDRIVNPLETARGVLPAGEDEITTFLLGPCKAKTLCPKPTIAEVISLGLPWYSELLEGPPIRDLIKNMLFEVRCSGAFKLLIGPGGLLPLVGKSELLFEAGSGILPDSNGGTVEVSGKDKMVGPPGDEKITAA